MAPTPISSDISRQHSKIVRGAELHSGDVVLYPGSCRTFLILDIRPKTSDRLTVVGFFENGKDDLRFPVRNDELLVKIY